MVTGSDITNMPDNATDVANTRYVDDAASNPTGCPPLSAGSLGGNLNVPRVGTNARVHQITFTAANVTGYTGSLLIGESPGTTGASFKLINDTIILPSTSGATSSFSFRSDGSKSYALYVESVSGSGLNRVANTWAIVSGVNFSTAITIGLLNNYTGTSLQNGTNTFSYFENFSGRTLSNFCTSTGTVAVDNKVTVGGDSSTLSSITSIATFADKFELITSAELAPTVQSF